MVRVTETGSNHTNAYTFEVDDRPGGVRVVRRPRTLGRILGTGFQAMGGLFLLIAPFAVAQAGAAGAVSCGLCAAIGFTLGPVLRRARQVLDVDGRTRTIDSAWWIGDRRIGLGAHHLKVTPTAMLSVERVRSYRGQAGPPVYMFAIRVAPSRRAAPVTVLYADRPAQAEDLTARIDEALALKREPSPVPVG